MWLLAHKHVEQWLLWIAVNVVSCGLYAWQGLYPTSILFAIYTVISILGYFKWLRMMCSRKTS
jgi:nicotinamide mononucleotide transporter